MLALPEDLVVDQHVDGPRRSRIRSPAFGVDADRPDRHPAGPDLGEHVPHPVARHQDLANRPALGQLGIVVGMAVDRGAEQDRRLHRDLGQHLRLADDAGKLGRISPDVPIVVDAIGGAQSIEAGPQIEKDPHRPARLIRSAHQLPDQAPRIAIEGQPAVGVGLLIEQVQRRGPGSSAKRCRLHRTAAITKAADDDMPHDPSASSGRAGRRTAPTSA